MKNSEFDKMYTTADCGWRVEEVRKFSALLQSFRKLKGYQHKQFKMGGKENSQDQTFYLENLLCRPKKGVSYMKE